jgi:hypothetical protein
MRFVFALPLIIHGLAHISGFIASWTPANVGYADRPWIFSPDIRVGGAVGKAFGLLWLIAAMGLIGAGMGILFGQEWWTALGMAGTVISMVVIIPWWNTVPPGARAGAAFNLIILIALGTPIREQILPIVFG